MQRDEVVAVEAVLDEELPVRLHRVLVRPLHHLHLRGLVRDQVEVVPRLAQVLRQPDRAGVEAAEDEPPVLLDAGRRAQPEAGAVEARAVAVGVRQPGQPTVVGVGPGVVEARHPAGVAGGDPAQLRATVTARVEEDPDLTVAAPPEHQRPTGDGAGAEVARTADLGGVPDVEPAPVEDRALFLGEHRVVDERGPVDPEVPVLGAVVDHPRCRGGRGGGFEQFGHVSSSFARRPAGPAGPPDSVCGRPRRGPPATPGRRGRRRGPRA